MVVPPGCAPDILYLAHRFPYPTDKGDRIRSYHMTRVLAGRARVHLAALADEPPAPGAFETLGRHCARVAAAPIGRLGRLASAAASLAAGGTATEGAFRSSALRERLRRWASETRFAAVLASSSAMAQYQDIPGLDRVPWLIDLVDVDSEKWLEYAAGGRPPMAWLHRAEGARLRRLERLLPDRALAVTLVSDAEAALFRSIRDATNVAAVTNGVDAESFRPAEGVAESGCVFVGALDYRPNVEGVRWFCEAVWPSVLERHPGATLRLVGRRPSRAVVGLGRLPGVEVLGTVPDIRPHLASAAVALAPLRIARGVQNKVLEALAMGKAVVASPGAAEGLRAEPGRDLIVATSAEEWSEAVARLLADPPLRHRLGASGRRHVEAEHDLGGLRRAALRAPGPVARRGPRDGDAALTRSRLTPLVAQAERTLPPTARDFKKLALGLAALTLYRGLVPLNVDLLSRDEAAAAFRRMRYDDPDLLMARGDWVITALQFGALACPTMAAVAVDRPRAAEGARGAGGGGGPGLRPGVPPGVLPPAARCRGTTRRWGAWGRGGDRVVAGGRAHAGGLGPSVVERARALRPIEAGQHFIPARHAATALRPGAFPARSGHVIGH